MANKIKYKWVKKLPVHKLSDEQLDAYFLDAVFQKGIIWETIACWDQRLNDIFSEQEKRKGDKNDPN